LWSFCVLAANPAESIRRDDAAKEVPLMRFISALLMFLITLTVCGDPASGAVESTTQPAVTAPPAKGEKAKDFSLATLDGESVSLSKLLQDGPLVLVVLRGWPGYQCPICTRQVGDLVGHAKEIENADARVVLVYPGTREKLKEHAEDFARGKGIPKSFYFVTDPDFAFTNQYGLRWDAPSETAYPSTFVIDRDGTIRFAQVSKTHGGRATAATILKELDQLK
jgi:peroxiredoxin